MFLQGQGIHGGAAQGERAPALQGRAPGGRRRGRAGRADERVQRAQPAGPRARGAPGRDRGALPEGRGGEQGVRRPLHRDRGAEQQPRQPLRGLLPAPLHARLQGGRPHRPGDRHQPDRRRGLPHLHGQREDGPARAGGLRGPGRRRSRPSRIGEGPIGKAAKTGENYFAEQVAHREPTPFDQPIAVIPLKIKDSVIGVISINKLLVQKTRLHHHGLRAVHACSPATPPPPSSPPSCTPPPRGSSPPCRASSTCSRPSPPSSWPRSRGRRPYNGLRIGATIVAERAHRWVS